MLKSLEQMEFEVEFFLSLRQIFICILLSLELRKAWIDIPLWIKTA
jgi:hypothetical protein